MLASINLSYWIFQCIAMGLTCFLIRGLKVTHPLGLLLIVVSISFVNAHIWDAALFFSIPNSFSLNTLIIFLTNGIMFWILVKLLPGIEVKGILPAIFAPVLFSATSMLISTYGPMVDWAGWAAWAYDLIFQLKNQLLRPE